MFTSHNMSHVMCHVSRVMCHLSHVMCHVSRVTCHMSCVTCHIYLFFLTKGWSLSVEGLLSTGSSPSIFFVWLKQQSWQCKVSVGKLVYFSRRGFVRGHSHIMSATEGWGGGVSQPISDFFLPGGASVGLDPPFFGWHNMWTAPY